MPGIFDLGPTIEPVPEAQPTPNVRRQRLGYILGAIVSTAAAVAAYVFILMYLQALMVRCWMSLGCNGDESSAPIVLAIAGYALLALFLAAIALPIFKITLWKASLLNVAPLAVLIALSFLWVAYRDYSWRANKMSAAKMAIYDAPAIQLGDIFVKKVEAPNGGVFIFVHVPFTVSRPVRSRSLAFLASPIKWEYAKFSPRADCNSGYTEPPYGFHLVDREYSEPPLSVYETGIKVVSGQLEPNKQYYLLQMRSYSHSLCHLSDFEEFDPGQLQLTLEPEHAVDVVRKGGE